MSKVRIIQDKNKALEFVNTPIEELQRKGTGTIMHTFFANLKPSEMMAICEHVGFKSVCETLNGDAKQGFDVCVLNLIKDRVKKEVLD